MNSNGGIQLPSITDFAFGRFSTSKKVVIPAPKPTPIQKNEKSENVSEKSEAEVTKGASMKNDTVDIEKEEPSKLTRLCGWALGLSPS